MLNTSRLLNRLKKIGSTSNWQKAVTVLEQYGWTGFSGLLTLVLFIFAWPGSDLFDGLSLLLVMALLGWSARQWRAMQISVVSIVLLSVVVILMNAASPVSGFLIPAMGVLLLACVLLAVIVDLAKTRLSAMHVNSLCWLVIISGVLLLILRSASRSAASLHYASLPLTNTADFLIGSVVVMMFLYLLYQRTHTRIQGLFIGLLPAILVGLYLMAYYFTRDFHPQALPDAILEHGLLLIHVPAMMIAFALLMSAVGFALLRLLSDSPWLKARQNRDILETVQTRLEDYLYRLLALAIILMGVGLVTGMAWSNLAWGHYWQAEPKQLMSLAVWLYYLAGLHFRLQKGMQMRPFAWWCIAGLPLLVMTVEGTNLWSRGLHSFAGL